MLEIHVENMTCGGCATRVTRAVQLLDDSAVVKADVPKRRVLIESELDVDALIRAITAAGYPATIPGQQG